MRITYDPSVDAAYIYLVSDIGPAEAATTYSCDPAAVDGSINLDFDACGRLLGIEVLDASRKLAAELLGQAESQAEAERRRGR